MLSHRQQGLSFLWGVLIATVLSVLFSIQSWVAVEIIEYTSYDLINYSSYLVGIFFCTIYKVQNSYQMGNTMWSSPSWKKSVQRANALIIWLAFITFGISFLTKDKGIGRLFVIVYILISWTVVLWWFRFGLSFITRRLVDKQKHARTIIIGSAETLLNFCEWFDEQLPLGLELIGWISLRREKEGLAEFQGIRYLGAEEQIESIFEKEDFQQVIYLDPFLSNEKVEYINRAAQKKGARLWFLSTIKKILRVPLHYYESDKISFFQVAVEPLENPLNRIWKRVMDIIVSSFVLVFIMPFVLLLVWAKQSKQSPGKIFFTQKRAGFFNQVFTIYKFRTMHEGHGREEVQATASDPRVFPFGAFLRRHNLDEFPQFWNVFIGKMSVVGPRPHMVQHDEVFQKMVDGYSIRSFVKPGVTGYAQVYGFRGEVVEVNDIKKRIELDHHYIRNWSLWLDFIIIIKTLKVLFFPHKTAY